MWLPPKGLHPSKPASYFPSIEKTVLGPFRCSEAM